MGKKDQKTVETPQLESVLRVEGREICVVAFFQDAYGGYDVVVGLADTDERASIAAALRSCAVAVEEGIIIPMAPDAPHSGHSLA